MNPYVLVLGLGLAALIQVSFLPTLEVAGVVPNLMVVLTVGWALLQDTRSALLWALIGGLWLDLLSGGPFGLQTISLLAVAYVAGLGGGTIFRAHLVLPVVMTLVGTVVYSLVTLLAYLVMGRELPPAGLLLRLLALEMAYNTVLMILVFPLLSLLHRATGRERLPLE